MCVHPHRSGAEVMEALHVMDLKCQEEKRLYDCVFDLLSYEKITFNGKCLDIFPSSNTCLTHVCRRLEEIKENSLVYQLFTFKKRVRCMFTCVIVTSYLPLPGMLLCLYHT